MNAKEILDAEFLKIRASILDVAAAFDRLDRAEGSIESDRRFQLLKQAMEIASDSAADGGRAEKMQMLFSNRFDPNWFQSFDWNR